LQIFLELEPAQVTAGRPVDVPLTGYTREKFAADTLRIMERLSDCRHPNPVEAAGLVIRDAVGQGYHMSKPKAAGAGARDGQGGAAPRRARPPDAREAAPGRFLCRIHEFVSAFRVLTLNR
jgi:hypothetical protein